MAVAPHLAKTPGGNVGVCVCETFIFEARSHAHHHVRELASKKPLFVLLEKFLVDGNDLVSASKKDSP